MTRIRSVKADKLNTVHLGDCVELMRSLPGGCSQLVIADPPYNLGKDFGGGPKWQDVEQWLPWCRTWLEECSRLLDDGGSIFVYLRLHEGIQDLQHDCRRHRPVPRNGSETPCR